MLGESGQHPCRGPDALLSPRLRLRSHVARSHCFTEPGRAGLLAPQCQAWSATSDTARAFCRKAVPPEKLEISLPAPSRGALWELSFGHTNQAHAAAWWPPPGRSQGILVASKEPPVRVSCPFCTPVQGMPTHRQSVRSRFHRSPESQLDSTMESSARTATATIERGCPAPYNLLGHAASTCGPLATSSQRGQMPAHSSAEG